MRQSYRKQTAPVNYTQTYPPSVQNIKSEPGLQQVKMEPMTEYEDGYYAGDEDISYDNYDTYYDEAGGMYTDTDGSFANIGHFAGDAGQVVEYSKPRAHKVLPIELDDIWQIL